MMFRQGIAAACVLFLTSCAGYHSMPPQDYSMAPDMLERVVFDQWGDPYPRSGSLDGLPIPPQVKRGTKGFSVQQYFRDMQLPYDRDQLLEDSANRVAKGIRTTRAERVVFLIKGFNNSYESNEREYANVRNWLAQNGPLENVVFVHVYWDAIYKGVGTAPAPVGYFAESMTYSNLAGACGFRELLGKLPAGTNVTFLTHSRGAAVGLSAAGTPLFDRDISTPCLKDGRGPERPNQLGDVRLTAFAPALGDGHLRARDGTVRGDLFDIIDRVYSTVNKEDPAVTKSLGPISLPDKFAGDTRFGGTPAYVEMIDSKFAARGHDADFAHLTFDQPSHDWMRYLGNDTEAKCLLWAGKILRDRPETCGLTR